MTTPVSDEHRGYLNCIDTAIKSVIVAIVVCMIAYALCDHYVSENTYASGHYYGSKVPVWVGSISEIGIIACLLTLIGALGESLLRTWLGRPLTRWELLAVVPLGLLTCIAPFAAIAFGLTLYDNFALNSLVGVLAIGIVVCLISSVGLVIYARVRRRQGSKPTTKVLSAAVLFSLAACIMLAVFVPLRSAEARKQHEIVVALESLGCRVHYDFAIERDGHRVVAKDPDDDGDLLAPLTGSDFRHQVVRVDLERTDPDVDEVLPYLRGLNNLKYVVLSTEISAGKIRQIEQALPSCEIKHTRR